MRDDELSTPENFDLLIKAKTICFIIRLFRWETFQAFHHDFQLYCKDQRWKTISNFDSICEYIMPDRVFVDEIMLNFINALLQFLYGPTSNPFWNKVLKETVLIYRLEEKYVPILADKRFRQQNAQ